MEEIKIIKPEYIRIIETDKTFRSIQTIEHIIRVSDIESLCKEHLIYNNDLEEQFNPNQHHYQTNYSYFLRTKNESYKIQKEEYVAIQNILLKITLK